MKNSCHMSLMYLNKYKERIIYYEEKIIWAYGDVICNYFLSINNQCCTKYIK